MATKSTLFLEHRLSPHFWSSKSNQLEYMKWLGSKLQIKDLQGWYGVSSHTFHKNRGHQLLSLYNNSPTQLITELFPQHNWEMWRFRFDLTRFNGLHNQRAYMDWLGNILGFSTKSDWYNIKLSDFTSNYGDKLASKYNNSPSSVVIHCYPEHDWKGWLFSEAPNLFWKDEHNVRDYMDWLGKKQQFTRMSDWYGVRCDHFTHNKGRSLLIKFGSSPFSVVTNVYKEHPWEHFRFHRLPKNSEKVKQEAHQILKSAETYLKINSPEDWYRVSKLQLKEALGETLVKKITQKPTDLLHHLQMIYPQHLWDKDLFMYFGTKRAAQRLLKLAISEIISQKEGHLVDIVEDYVHPTIKLTETQNVTFDIFIPSMNVAFEYGGQQHYDPTIFGTQQKLDNDIEKGRLAAENGIILITIPYWWDKKKESLTTRIDEQMKRVTTM